MTRRSKEPHELGTPLGFPYRAGAIPFIPEQMAWHEEKRHADQYLLGKAGRRLSERNQHVSFSGAQLHEALNGVIESLPVPGQPSFADHVHRAVSWPGFFEPRMIACGPNG